MSIELRNVLFHYPEQANKIVLDIPRWSLSKGEQVFIHGASGGGKSTLLNILSGLVLPCEGSVDILNHRLDEMKSRKRDKFRANYIGYVFQQFNLIPYLNALDNLLLAGQFSQHATKKSMQADIKALLHVLNISKSDWHRPTRTLSIGQQQRVAIARALINKPQLLIADEPTSSLDSENRDAFMEVLMSTVKSHDMTLVLVSHDLSLANYFNRVDSLCEINHAKKGSA